MKTNITRLPVAELPPDGPRLAIAMLGAGETTLARYLRHADSTIPFRSGNTLVVIARSVPLSTSDQVEVTDSLREAMIFRIGLKIRHYTGTLFANLVTVGLVEMALGDLPSGQYEVVMTETILQFQDLEHPENAANLTSSSTRLPFAVH